MTSHSYERPTRARHRAVTTPDERFAREFDEVCRRDNGWTPKHRGNPNHDRDLYDLQVHRGLVNLAAALGRPAYDDGDPR